MKLAREPRQFSAARLLEAIEATGKSYETLAPQIQVSGQTLRNWSLGISEPPASKLDALAALFGKTLNYFYEEAPR